MSTTATLRTRNPGTMVPATLPAARSTPDVQIDGRALPDFRADLRRIPSLRNALSVVGLFAQTAAVIAATIVWAPWSWPIAFVLMGRTHAQFASLMHEAAHRMLFANKAANDWVGRWLLGYPALTSTDAYRRVHMAHHREEFGPNEPDVPLYRGYPIAPDSFRRKLVRDATGRTGTKLLRGFLRGVRNPDPKIRNTVVKILLVQAVMITAAVVGGVSWVYPLFWIAPYLTVWRVINRLRSVAEHGGMQQSKDRRETTHSVRQQWPARFLLVPYNIGWHLAHHVDSGVPFRNLPRYHRALREAGYVDDTFEYPSYRAIWRELRTPAG